MRLNGLISCIGVLKETLEKQTGDVINFPKVDPLTLLVKPEKPTGGICNIMKRLADDPVAYQGHVYDRQYLQQWYNTRGTDPINRQPMTEDPSTFFTLFETKKEIAEYRQKKSEYKKRLEEMFKEQSVSVGQQTISNLN